MSKRIPLGGVGGDDTFDCPTYNLLAASNCQYDAGASCHVSHVTAVAFSRDDWLLTKTVLIAKKFSR